MEDRIKGPKINPKTPNIFRPSNTPNTVIKGGTSPNFLRIVKRRILSIEPTNNKQYKVRPIPLPTEPVANTTKQMGTQTAIVPTTGIMDATPVISPHKMALSTPKII